MERLKEANFALLQEVQDLKRKEKIAVQKENFVGNLTRWETAENEEERAAALRY